ncbi:MAG TPA: DUF4129 domain-containing protein [Coleofasciculaceae cyanobacterium]
MSMGSFEKNNLGWQLSQMRQRVGEWWELKTSQILPNMELPSWTTSPILETIIKVIFWVVLGLLIIWIVLQLGQLLYPYLYTLKNQGIQRTNSAIITPICELSVTDWWQRSQKFQQQGNYREACICLYRAMLQQLHDTGIAKHQVSRTDGEYLKVVQQLPQPSPYQTLLTIHQQLCFSKTEASPRMFEQCQQAYRDIKTP